MNISNLAKLVPTDEENDFAEIVAFAHGLGDSGTVSPFLPALSLNELRSDTVAACLTQDEIEKLAPKSEKGMIAVPRVVS